MHKLFELPTIGPFNYSPVMLSLKNTGIKFLTLNKGKL